MEFENIYRVESFLVNNNESEYVNVLLAFGWKLLAITQYKDEDNSYAKYVIGADKDTFEKFDVSFAKNKVESESTKEYDW